MTTSVRQQPRERAFSEPSGSSTVLARRGRGVMDLRGYALCGRGDFARLRLRADGYGVTWAGAFLGRELVAFVQVVWDGGAHGFLLDTVVHPSHQRIGLGRAVVAAAVHRAAAKGCKWLHVDHEPHLESFYRDACGFGTTAAGLRRLA
jgi:ribosomal protein S18 acetylase RimI-like enzyme